MENVIAWPSPHDRPPFPETEPEPKREAAGPGSTIGEFAFAGMLELHHAMLDQEVAIRAGVGPDPVHDMRVAVRRQRAALSVFEDAIPARASRLRSELRWVTASLGPVRDLDVLRERVLRWIEEAPPEEREGLAVLDTRLTERHAVARVRLVRALDSRRYMRLKESLVAFLGRGPSSRPDAAGLPALVVVPELIAQRYRSARNKGRRADKGSSSADLHALRIRCKRLRYALEFAAPLYPGASKPMIRRLVRLQDLLGDIRDAEVVVENLRRLGEASGRRLPAEAVFAMGRLAERQDREAAALRRSFRGSFTAIEGKRWKQLRREMERKRRAGAVPITG